MERATCNYTLILLVLVGADPNARNVLVGTGLTAMDSGPPPADGTASGVRIRRHINYGVLTYTPPRSCG